MAPCAVNDGLTLPSNDITKDANEVDISRVQDMAEVVAGYLDCMAEAVRYLIEVERYPECHPAVEGLRRHLADYKSHLVHEALRNCDRPLSAGAPTTEANLDSDRPTKELSLDFLERESWPL